MKSAAGSSLGRPALMALILVPVLGGAIVNGDFSAGLAGWEVGELRLVDGEAESATSVSTANMLWNGGDESAASLQVGANAGRYGGGGVPDCKAYALASLRQDVPAIPSTVLSCEWAVQSFGTVFAAGSIDLGARLRITRLNGPAGDQRQFERAFVAGPPIEFG
jgi:hypothetical protein